MAEPIAPGLPEGFPPSPNGRTTAGDLWMLLAHPQFGLGALHTRVHLGQEDMERRTDGLKENQEKLLGEMGGVRSRLIAKTADEAEKAHFRMAIAEDRRARHRKIWEWTTERVIYVVGTSIGAILLTHLEWVHEVIHTLSKEL